MVVGVASVRILCIIPLEVCVWNTLDISKGNISIRCDDDSLLTTVSNSVVLSLSCCNKPTKTLNDTERSVYLTAVGGSDIH